jgi:hypothetical protein
MLLPEIRWNTEFSEGEIVNPVRFEEPFEACLIEMAISAEWPISNVNQRLNTVQPQFGQERLVVEASVSDRAEHRFFHHIALLDFELAGSPPSNRSEGWRYPRISSTFFTWAANRHRHRSEAPKA